MKIPPAPRLASGPLPSVSPAGHRGKQESASGQAVVSMGCEPGFIRGRPCDRARLRRERESLRVARPCASPPVDHNEGGLKMRWIGLDCHLEFIEVAILDAAGAPVSTGRIESSEEAIRLFAESLAADDRVALESSANAAAIAALIRPHVGQVLIANSRRLAQISQARAKTDRLDARTLAKLLRAGALEEVWMPDERTRARRRLCSRRATLIRARTRAKNEAHAVLARNLKGRPA